VIPKYCYLILPTQKHNLPSAAESTQSQKIHRLDLKKKENKNKNKNDKVFHPNLANFKAPAP
jgi:hypothetical protein